MRNCGDAFLRDIFFSSRSAHGGSFIQASIVGCFMYFFARDVERCGEFCGHGRLRCVQRSVVARASGLGVAARHSQPRYPPKGHPTRLFSRLNPRAFEACFMEWTQQLQQHTEGEILAIDGKSVRRSFDTASGQGALHLVSVWACEARLVLAQQAVGGHKQ